MKECILSRRDQTKENDTFATNLDQPSPVFDPRLALDPLLRSCGTSWMWVQAFGDRT